MKRNHDLWMTLTIVSIAFTRLLPHWPNFTPVLAVALCGGLLFNDRRSVLVPLAAMILSDLAMGVAFGTEYAFHTAQPYVYGCIILTAMLGRGLDKWSPSKAILLGGSAAGIGFFLITNAAVWLHGSMYPHSIEGLMTCYGAGLAFYRDSGNFLLNGIVSTWLFGGGILLVKGALNRTYARRPA
ncbi:MAG: hypothetical protein FGM33_10380 [Candidatus Kapabacteria bacterium]|nr:hypothetical protein [Candidatus Kapabacteria bacterium]